MEQCFSYGILYFHFHNTTPGQSCVEWVNRENDRRLKEAATATLAASKGARTHRRQAALPSQEENYPAYQAGGF